MPGAYAHLAMACSLVEPNRLTASGIPDPAIAALQRFRKYCELGTVSPDYPYLDIIRAQSRYWADHMHYSRTCDRIRAGTAFVSGLDGTEKEKSLAWLLGYTSHVFTDVTIHPVVELKVGPYEMNKAAHRICEMHQDVFIYPILKIGDIGEAEFLLNGIGTCNDPQDEKRLDPQIKTVWKEMLSIDSSETNDTMAFHDWHKHFKSIVSDISEAGRHFGAWSRHVASNKGLLYPESADNKYIDDLDTPRGKMHYLKIFERAQHNVLIGWKTVCDAIFSNDTKALNSLPNWNLDTGRDPEGVLTLWSA